MGKTKVTLIRIGEKAESTARSLLVAGSLGGVITGLGCGPAEEWEPQGNDSLGSTGFNEEALSAGSGVFELTSWGPGHRFHPVSSTVDEFTRTGERIKLRLPAWQLWERLNPGSYLGEDALMQQLEVVVTARFVDGSVERSTRTLKAKTVTGTGYEMTFESGNFLIPTRTDAIRFTVQVTDPTSGKTVTMGQAPDFIEGPPVFGGERPNKTAFFDNTADGLRRERIIEFGNPVKGAKLQLAFSDYRADQIADRMNLKTQTGRAKFPTRFGTMEGPVYGRVEYEVLFGHKFDTSTWQSEQPLVPTVNSRVGGLGRTVYQGELSLPANAQGLELYFHVRAWLVVDYSNLQMVESWYQHGQRVLLKDGWDNPAGPGTNYTFDLE